MARRRICVGLLGILAAIAAASALARPVAAQPPDINKFIRFVPDGNGYGMLELSTVTYRNPDGLSVDLIAAVHIADPSYYAALNDQFRSYDHLLYEMVKPKEPPAGATTAPAQQPRRSLAWVGGLQRFMQRSLDLQYQLDGIDYKAKNFVHADLDAETFVQMEQAKGESIPGLMLNQMMRQFSRELADPSAADEQTQDSAAFFAALQSDDKPRALKVMLARELASGLVDLDDGNAADPSILIAGRNRAAIEVLKQRIAAGDRKLAIFYGAGHLPGMQAILTGELGFVQDGPPRWRIAWDLTHATVPLTAGHGPATQPGSRPSQP
jgi:hypothetical protein